MKYYAVAVGRSTGVFGSWDEAKPLVSGYKGAKYKSFNSKDLAEKYVSSGGADNKVANVEGQSYIKNVSSTCRIYANAKDQSEDKKFRVCGAIGGFKGTLLVNSWSWLEDYAELSTLDMQCYGYIHALKVAYKKGYREFVIVFKNDCFMGWGMDWKPKSEAAKYYKNCISILKSRDVSIHFEKFNKSEHYHLEYMVNKNLGLDNKSEEYEMFGYTGDF